MLKLLKYEWKACARTCLPLYGVLILMSFVTHLLYGIPENNTLSFMLPAISSMLYMCVMVAAFVVTAVILIQRFYKNLLGSEGYLMFTLPVTVTQHLLTKTIIAVVMIALSGLAAMISIGIFADMSFGAFFVDMIKGMAQNGGLLFGLELFVLLVLGIAGMALFIYMCIALGHLASKHRLLMSVVWYFVLSTVLQFLLLIVMMGAGNVMPEAFVNLMKHMLNGITPTGALHLAMLSICAVILVKNVVYFLVTRWILVHKLNLE